VEPPGARLQAFVVAVPELEWINRERVRREERSDRGEQAAVDPRCLGAPVGLEDVERDLGRAPQGAGQRVADGNAVLQREEAVHRVQQQPLPGDDADAGELQAVAAIDDAHVARLGGGSSNTGRSAHTVNSGRRPSSAAGLPI
jgi:hypothetical protein